MLLVDGASNSGCDPAAVPDGAAEIAGDERTAEAVADAFAAARGLSGRFDPLPIEALGNADMEAMFRWFVEPPAYDADLALTARLVGEVTELPAFAAAHGVGAD